MSYHRSRTPLGADDLPAALAAALAKASPILGTAAKIISDPYLPEAACRVSQLHAIENKKAVPTCATTPAGRGGGIGIRKAMPLLRGYVYAERHPVVKPLAIAGALGVPLLIGFLLGRRS